MNPRALALAVLLSYSASTSAQTQTPSAPAPPFQGLFVPPVRQPAGTHVIFDSPLLTDTWLLRHTPQANGGSFGDNAAVADFWYDAVHRRVMTRSISLHEVDDPVDLRLGRAPGGFPNAPDFTARLPEGTTVGQIGFEPWTANGFGAYFAAVQGAVRDTRTGYLDLATATGRAGRTRTGSSFDPDDLVKHVRLHPAGQLEVGFETSPDARADPMLLVHGNQQVEGHLAVGASATLTGPGCNVPHACTLRETTAIGRGLALACDAGQVATGGGGACGSGQLTISRPLAAGPSMPSGWEASCSRTGTHVVYAICCAQ